MWQHIAIIATFSSFQYVCVAETMLKSFRGSLSGSHNFITVSVVVTSEIKH